MLGLNYDLEALIRDHPEVRYLEPDEIARRFWAYDLFAVLQARLRAEWRINVTRPLKRWLIDKLWRLTKRMR